LFSGGKYNDCIYLLEQVSGAHTDAINPNWDMYNALGLVAPSARFPLGFPPNSGAVDLGEDPADLSDDPDTPPIPHDGSPLPEMFDNADGTLSGPHVTPENDSRPTNADLLVEDGSSTPPMTPRSSKRRKRNGNSNGDRGLAKKRAAKLQGEKLHIWWPSDDAYCEGQVWPCFTGKIAKLGGVVYASMTCRLILPNRFLARHASYCVDSRI
jgi:hypothetical protein